MGGLFISDLTGDFINGMDYGAAAVLDICMYPCAVISKFDKHSEVYN